ncbi:MAG TPA: glycosyltransferase family 39 protein [Chloroflexia bacterium]|nr:glycosyltransferase family 39 protein [Chloroflexia bacterium]
MPAPPRLSDAVPVPTPGHPQEGGRTAWRAVLALLALLTAGAAEWLVEVARSHHAGGPPLLSWILFAGSGLVLVAAAGRRQRVQPARPALLTAQVRVHPHRRLVLGLLVAVVACAVAALPLFWLLNAAPTTTTQPFLINSGPWLLYGAALMLLGAAVLVWERHCAPVPTTPAAGWPGERLPPALEWASMGGMLALALLLRLTNLERVPPGLWFDEAQNGIVGLQLVTAGNPHVTFVGEATQMGALYFYLVGWMVQWFGPLAWSVRVLPAISGALMAPLLYLLGARLYGWRVGLAAAGLVAVSAWNITFSRYGIASLPTVLLDVAIYLCLVQALRTGRLGYYAGAGVLLGLALQMYYPARLVPILALLVLAHLAVSQRVWLRGRLYRREMRVRLRVDAGLRRARWLLPVRRQGLLVALVATTLAFLPVGLFALQQPAVFNQRVDTVSIFRPDIQRDHPDILQTNIVQHLLMFHWEGDENAKQNLPHAPMLDPVTAALFLAGVVACLARLGRWQYFFPLAWLLISMLGGILSINAPHAQRTLENSVVTALIAAIFLGEAWQVISRTGLAWLRAVGGRSRARLAAGAVSALAVLGGVAWAGSLTTHRYFDLQANDYQVWWEMNSAEGEAGRLLARYGASRAVYLSPPYYQQAAISYLAPGAAQRRWAGMAELPLVEARDSLVLLDPNSAAGVSLFAQLYPHATFQILYSPGNTTPLMYSVFIPAADIAGLHGVQAVPLDPGGTPLPGRTVPDLGVPEGVAGTWRLTTTLQVVEFGSYRFDWPDGGAADIALVVDGAARALGEPLLLASGPHSLALTVTRPQAAAGNAARLLWLPPGGVQGPVPAAQLFDPLQVVPYGLTGLFRGENRPDAPPSAGRIDATLHFDFPDALAPEPFSADWRGHLYVPQAGHYVLAVEQRGTSALYFDGRKVLTNAASFQIVEAPLDLSAGWHFIHLVAQKLSPGAYLFLYWTPPDRARSAIAPVFLQPLRGNDPADRPPDPHLTLDAADGQNLPADRVNGPLPAR